jgi:LPPG:FO 2-phospho-L-lactate transferase
MTGDSRTYVALSGGIGGAKLSLGLARLLGERLTIVVNTGDDFEHLGLAISPDVDTTLYTLAGVANPETGWGRRDETWSFMKAVAELGGPTWFKLGDRDLAIHVERTVPASIASTLMQTTDDKIALAGHCLSLCERLAETPRKPGKRHAAGAGA